MPENSTRCISFSSLEAGNPITFENEKNFNIKKNVREIDVYISKIMSIYSRYRVFSLVLIVLGALMFSQMNRTADTVPGSSAKKRKVWKHLPPGTQMGELQVAAIHKVIKSEGNLLVWGLGNDSPYWHDSTQGKVVFIEPKGIWYKKISDEYPYLEVYTVNYTTYGMKSFDKYINSPEIWSELDIRSQLPPVVKHTHWNVIIVDAPPGHTGRYQSIYTSTLLARNGTHIFVDDYERKVENELSRKMLGSPTEVVKRHAKRHVGTNEQAHFIHIKHN